MVYIFNKYIPPKKKVTAAIEAIYGIGPKRSAELLSLMNVSKGLRFYQLGLADISKLEKCVSLDHKVGSFLLQDISERVQRYAKIRCYKGIRHKNKLPVRGQRTHTNAQTAKRALKL